MRTIRYPAVLALLLPVPALADTLPLTRGYYVETGTPCRGAPNVALRDYRGDGIGSSKAGQCHARILARIGQRYTLRQSCVQYGGPRQYRAAERLKIRVDSRTSYTDLSADSGNRRPAAGAGPALVLRINSSQGISAITAMPAHIPRPVRQSAPRPRSMGSVIPAAAAPPIVSSVV